EPHGTRYPAPVDCCGCLGAFGHRSGQVHQLVKALTPQAGDKPAWMSNHGMSTCSSVVLGIGTWAHQPWPAARQAWPAVDPTPRQVRRTYHRRLPRCGGAPTLSSRIFSAHASLTPVSTSAATTTKDSTTRLNADRHLGS